MSRCCTLFSFAAALLMTLFSVGCMSSSSPPVEIVKQKLMEQVPAYISIGNVDLEFVANNDGLSLFNFKTTISPKETLYELQEKAPSLRDVPEVSDGPDKPAPVKLLRPLQKSGESISLYGSLVSAKKVDKWIIDPVTLDFDLNTLGKPRGNFGPGTVVLGTAQAQEALARQQAEADTYRKAVKELVEMRHSEEAQQAAADRAKRLEVLKPGTVYRGTLTRIHELLGPPVSQEIVLTITELKGANIRFDAINPATKERQTFFGDVDLGRKDGMLHVSPVGAKDLTATTERDRSRWSFYFGVGSLTLDLVDAELRGEGEVGAWDGDRNLWNTEKKRLFDTVVHYQLRLTRQVDASEGAR